MNIMLFWNMSKPHPILDNLLKEAIFCYNSCAMNEFKVTIDTFDGPLDLMLHLIKEKQLDLMNLDMNIESVYSGQSVR